MRIQKFQASDMREAIAHVKRALGPDAVIVSTRDVRRGLLGRGVEVTAAAEADAEPEAPRAPAPRAAETDIERLLAPLRAELRSLKAAMRPNDLRDELAALRQEIAALGGRARRKAAASDAAPLVAPSTARVVALVGPTGVGKTTTIAKLAARAALVEHRRVALITIDDYRVGGEEQIRTFADLIGVPLSTVSAHELGAHVAALGAAQRIYIDTAGRSPRDEPAVAELGAALRAVPDVEVHLTLTAGTPLAAMQSIHRRLAGVAAKRLLFTKIDEADDLEAVAHAPGLLGLPVSYIATGQRVPEDLEDATAARLVQLARASAAMAVAQ